MTPAVFHCEPGSALSIMERARLSVSLTAASLAIHDARLRGAPIPEHGVVVFSCAVGAEQWLPHEVLDELQVIAVAR